MEIQPWMFVLISLAVAEHHVFLLGFGGLLTSCGSGCGGLCGHLCRSALTWDLPALGLSVVTVFVHCIFHFC